MGRPPRVTNGSAGTPAGKPAPRRKRTVPVGLESDSVYLKPVASPRKADPAQPTLAETSPAAQKDVDFGQELHVKDLLRPFRITKGKEFRLTDHPTEDKRDAYDFDKSMAKALLADGLEDLQELQDKLYAQNNWSLLLIFQAMDAAGKDSTIKHVMSGVNPVGCQVHAFKRPSEEELDHDFLWRTSKALPERGRIGIFNRSYYEEVLVVRVRPEILVKQRIPEGLTGGKIWQRRLKAIKRYETFLAQQGTRVVKFFLNVGRDEQRKRLIERIDDPTKNWKFEVNDLAERQRWKDYMHCYEAAIKATASKHAPWYVIPADDKAFMRVAVMAAIRHELKQIDPSYPEIDDVQRAKLQEARKLLISEETARGMG